MDKRPRIIGKSRLLALPELADDRIGPLIGVVAVDDNAGESTARHPEAQCQHQVDQRLDWLTRQQDCHWGRTIASKYQHTVPSSPPFSGHGKSLVLTSSIPLVSQTAPFRRATRSCWSCVKKSSLTMANGSWTRRNSPNKHRRDSLT